MGRVLIGAGIGLTVLFYLLPYRGIGSGILRAFAAYPHIALFDDRDARQFKVVVSRPGWD